MPLAIKLIRPLYWTMVCLLTTGLACVLVMGFGGHVPEWVVIGEIGGGTAAMVCLFALLISGGRRA